MNAIRNRIAIPCLALALSLTLPLAQSATVFETSFGSADGYSTGALTHANWSVNNAGDNTQWIVQQDSANPSAPTSLGSGRHPAALSGTQLLWFSPNTTGVSANQTALLTFAPVSSRLQEPFIVSLDLFASPTGGSGQSFTMHLARDNNATATTAPRISLTSSSTSSMNLNVWDGGTSTSGGVSLPKDTWLRFELSVNASASSAGTYTVSVYQLDSSGSIVGTLYSSTALAYTLSSGFNSLRFLTNSSRTDYWIDSITVSTIPEPGVTGLLAGALALLASTRRSRRLAPRD